MAGRLQQQNEELAAQLRAMGVGSSPAKRHMDSALLQAMIRKQDGCVRPWLRPPLLWYWLPAGRPRMLRLPAEPDACMLRAVPGCRELSLLREDSASQQEELLRSLTLLQAAHKREEDLRRQASMRTCSSAAGATHCCCCCALF